MINGEEYTCLTMQKHCYDSLTANLFLRKLFKQAMQ